MSTVKEIAMQLMNHKPPPVPSHGLRVVTTKRSGSVPDAEMPWLACECHTEDGTVVHKDFSATAIHMLMHPSSGEQYYNRSVALQSSGENIFELVPADDLSITKIFFKNKYAVMPNDMPQFVRLKDDQARRALQMGWHATCDFVRESRYI